jgi:THO complex subunit 1 transcription elongation factor
MGLLHTLYQPNHRLITIILGNVGLREHRSNVVFLRAGRVHVLSCSHCVQDQDTELIGRVMVRLAQTLPFNDRSGLNTPGIIHRRDPPQIEEEMQVKHMPIACNA